MNLAGAVLVVLVSAARQETAPQPIPSPSKKPSIWDIFKRTSIKSVLSNEDIVSGLKEALGQGTRAAVSNLGRDGGFLDNPRVRIPVPSSLQPVEKGLRAVRQEKIVDRFVTALNRAAERAVPQALSIFGDAIKSMGIADAKSILKGEKDAATRSFRRTSEGRLNETFLPIIRQATSEVGLAAAYKNLMRKAGPLGRLAGKDAEDLDGYVTRKAVDGLFTLIADEEKRIREDPAARTSDVLRKVFGADASS